MEIKKLLEDYAGELRSEMDWARNAPYYTEAAMAAGRVHVKDAFGKTLAIFFTEDTPPSYPVTRRDIRGAALLVNVLNHLATH